MFSGTSGKFNDSHLILRVENHGLGVGDPADVVLMLGGGQPHSGRQLVV